MFRGRKGRGSAAKHKGPPPWGVAVAPAEPLQSTPPRAQRHRRACTRPSSARPRSLKARSGQTLKQKATILSTAFLQSRPRVGGVAQAAFRPALPDSLRQAALTPLHPRRARPCCCYRRRSRGLLPSHERFPPSHPPIHPPTRHRPASRERPRSPGDSECACARRREPPLAPGLPCPGDSLGVS